MAWTTQLQGVSARGAFSFCCPGWWEHGPVFKIRTHTKQLKPFCIFYIMLAHLSDFCFLKTSVYILQVFLPVAFGMVAMALFLVLAPIVWSPKVQYIYASLFMLGSLLLYLPFVHFKIHFEFMDKITTYLQLLLEVSPANYKREWGPMLCSQIKKKTKGHGVFSS